MIVFGWGGGKVKNHGPALPQMCPSCGHEGFFHYFTVTKWFRLYWIPIIPYSTKHFLACPVCTNGGELTSPVERQRVHTLVASTASMLSGLVDPETYAEQVRLAFGEFSPAPAFGEVSPAPALPPSPQISPPSTPVPPSPMAKRIRAGESWSG